MNKRGKKICRKQNKPNGMPAFAGMTLIFSCWRGRIRALGFDNNKKGSQASEGWRPISFVEKTLFGCREKVSGAALALSWKIDGVKSGQLEPIKGRLHLLHQTGKRNDWLRSSELIFNDYKRKLLAGFRRSPKFVRVRTDRESVCVFSGVGFVLSVPKECRDCGD